MAITIDYVVLPHLKKKDGTNFIRLRVTNNRKSKYIKTNLIVEPEHITRSGNLKHQGLIDQANDEVKKWRTAAGKIPSYITNEMDLDGVVRAIERKLAEGEDFTLNFARYGMKLAEGMKGNTANGYMSAIHSFVRYFGHEPDISEITVKAMRHFEDFLRREPQQVFNIRTGKAQATNKVKSEGTVVYYISNIRAIYKKARQEFNDPDLGIMRIPFDIFDYYSAPSAPAPEHRDIPLEWVQMMIDQRKDLKGRERKAIDAFLISFGLMGINTVDMYTCAKAKEGVVHYFRTKTTNRKADRAEMYVRIEPCIGAIMSEYSDKDLLFNYHLKLSNQHNFVVSVNTGLRQWQKRNGLSDFTFYSARHTWATIAASKRVGVDYALVTEGLTHSNQSRSMDMVYIRKDWERVWDANAKVLSLLKW